MTFLGHHLIEKMDEKTNEDISLLIPQVFFAWFPSIMNPIDSRR